jgi:hypothetical protein
MKISRCFNRLIQNYLAVNSKATKAIPSLGSAKEELNPISYLHNRLFPKAFRKALQVSQSYSNCKSSQYRHSKDRKYSILVSNKRNSLLSI